MNERISFEEYMELYGSLTYSNVGRSMLPLLRQGRDLLIVEKKGEGRCKAGDVVLFRRPSSRYVLHRIIEVRPNDYVTMGDNCITKEYGIHDEDILGVMTGFVKDGKKHSVTETGYRAYSSLVTHTVPVRISLKKALRRLRRPKH